MALERHARRQKERRGGDDGEAADGCDVDCGRDHGATGAPYARDRRRHRTHFNPTRVDRPCEDDRSMRSPPVSRGVLATAARASWLAPTAVLLVVGVTTPGGVLPEPVIPASAVIPVTTAAAVVGLLIGTFAAPASAWYEGAGLERRHALLGIGLSAAVLVMTGIASVVGALSGREAAEELERATRAALRDSASWNGGGRVDGAVRSGEH